MTFYLSSFSQMKLFAKRLVANEQGGPLSALRVSPGNPVEHQTLGGIVVHAVTVLLCRSKADILLPFYHMLHDPSYLVVSHDAYTFSCCVADSPLSRTECLFAYNARRPTSSGSCRIWAIIW